MHIVLALLLVFANIRFRTYRNILQNWLGIVYVCSMNILYYVLCYPRLTWDFSSKKLSVRFLRQLHTFIVNPLIILLFLHHIPKRLFDQVRYFMKWIFFSLMIEYIGQRFFHMIYFMRGWNLAWSGVLYGSMYFLSYLVRKHPLLTYLISLLNTLFLLFFFQIPVISI